MTLKALLALLSILAATTACAITRAGGASDAPRAEESDVHADDVTLHARMAGSAEAEDVLIAIHGGPGMSSDYMASMEQLAGGQLAVVTYDQRGTGRSSSPPPHSTNYTLDKYVADLDAVRQKTGHDKVHLFGHSWGGIVALRYATVYPERVHTIILMGSGAPNRSAADTGEIAMGRVRSTLQEQGIIPLRIETLDDLLPSYFSDPTFVAPDELQNMHYSASAERLTRQALGSFDFVDQVGQLEHRVLVLYGIDDPFGLPMAEATHDALSRADVEFFLLHDCGHFWHECPETFFQHVETFLNLP